MISSIEITRFRGIRAGKLEDLTPLVVLVGPNGCGKSTILDALLIGANPSPGDGVARAVLRHQGVEEGPRWLFWRAEENSAAEIVVTTQSDSYRKCAAKLHTRPLPDPTSVDCEFESRVENTLSSGTSTTEFRKSDYQYRDDRVRALKDVPQLRLVESRGDGLQPPLHQLYSDTARSGRGDEARALIAEVVAGLRDIEILTELNRPILYLVYQDSAIPVALSGDGIHALVRVTLELASLPGGVVLFEEPEVHQHPGAIRQTMRAVLAAVRRDIQVILTTHSLELIDALLAESSAEDLEKLSLYRLDLQDGKLISVRMPGPDVAFSRQEIEDDLR